LLAKKRLPGAVPP